MWVLQSRRGVLQSRRGVLQFRRGVQSTTVQMLTTRQGDENGEDVPPRRGAKRKFTVLRGLDAEEVRLVLAAVREDVDQLLTQVEARQRKPQRKLSDRCAHCEARRGSEEGLTCGECGGWLCSHECLTRHIRLRIPPLQRRIEAVRLRKEERSYSVRIERVRAPYRRVAQITTNRTYGPPHLHVVIEFAAVREEKASEGAGEEWMLVTCPQDRLCATACREIDKVRGGLTQSEEDSWTQVVSFSDHYEEKIAEGSAAISIDGQVKLTKLPEAWLEDGDAPREGRVDGRDTANEQRCSSEARGSAS